MKKLLIVALLFSAQTIAIEPEYTHGTNSFVNVSCTPPIAREDDTPLTIDELDYNTVIFYDNIDFSDTTITFADTTDFSSPLFSRQTDIYCNLSEPADNFPVGTITVNATTTDTGGRVSQTSLQGKQFIVLADPNPPEQGERITTGLVAYYPITAGVGTIVYDTIGYTDLTLTGSTAWSNGISFTGGIASAPGIEITTALKQSNKFTVETWVQPANLIQTGPARIVALTQDSTLHNMHIGQVGKNISLRLSGNNGDITTTNPLNGELVQLIYTYDGSYKRLYVNGVLNSTYAITVSLSDTWRDTDILALGNEPIVDRSWQGTIKLVAIYNRVLTQAEIEINYSVGAEGVSPPNAPTNVRF